MNNEAFQSCKFVFFFLFVLYKKISGDATPLTQKEMCPSKHPNLFFESTLIFLVSQRHLRVPISTLVVLICTWQVPICTSIVPIGTTSRLGLEFIRSSQNTSNLIFRDKNST